MTLNKLMKSARRKARLSQLEMAKLFGMHFQQISQIERGVVDMPYKHLAILRDKLNVEQMDIYAAAMQTEADRLAKFLPKKKVGRK